MAESPDRPNVQAQQLLRSRLTDANQMLAAAETEMENAVGQLAPVLVGDKRMTSEALDRAFHKVKNARVLIADLEQLLARLSVLPAP